MDGISKRNFQKTRKCILNKSFNTYDKRQSKCRNGEFIV